MIQIEKPASMEQRLISKILKRIKFKNKVEEKCWNDQIIILEWKYSA